MSVDSSSFTELSVNMTLCNVILYFVTVVTACTSRPCQNGGHCFGRVHSYQCHCQEGYTGENCQIEPPSYLGYVVAGIGSVVGSWYFGFLPILL